MLDSVLVWFRRDLRDYDHAALGEALRRARSVYCCFVYDRDILDLLPNVRDRRVEFIHGSLAELDAALQRNGGRLIVQHARATEAIPRLARELGVSAVFSNRDYEPQAKARDANVAAELARNNIGFESFKDQAIFDGLEVLTLAGKPFTVFTPYKRAWLKRLTEDDLTPHSTGGGTLVRPDSLAALPSLAELGFEPTNLDSLGITPGMRGARCLTEDFARRMAHYAERRDYPAIKGVSYLSVHLRFGTISIRELVAHALASGAARAGNGAATWLSELIWREFYFMILDHFPHVADRSFKPEYDVIAWERGEQADAKFAAWCDARTGFPLVDAAMRQLNSSGYMHNRLRMVVASFLTKDLGIDWRRGEAYFAQHLNDFDLAANNGGWQWAASSGCDAQPYFRIFNPVTQSERFDADGRFIRRYLPELANIPGKYIHAPWLMDAGQQSKCGVIVGRDTPAPIVEHDAARRATLARYAVVKRAAAS